MSKGKKQSTFFILSQLASSAEEKDVVASTKIQKWFRKLPFRWQATEIMNKHEKELGLLEIDLKERAAFVDEVSTEKYSKITRRENAAVLALSALKANKLNNDQASTIIEISQFARIYGNNAIQFEHLLDSKKKFTDEAQILLTKLFIRWGEENDIPRKYSGPGGCSKFLTDLQQELALRSLTSSYCDLCYLIQSISVTDELLLNDFHGVNAFNLPSGYIDGKPECFFNASYALSDLMGSVLYGDNWLKKEYRLGAIGINDIRRTQERDVRPASISSPIIVLPTSVHEGLVSPAGYSRHDEYHRIKGSQEPKNVRRALARVMFLTREITGHSWSNEMWTIEDKDYNKYLQKECSNELLFYLISSFFFKIESHKADAQKCRPRFDDPKRKEKLQEKVAKGEYVFNKDKSQLMIWIMVMDMVDHSELWKNTLKLNINTKEIHYDHHIALYACLKKNQTFKELDVKQKLAVLEKTYHLYDEERQPYEDLDYSDAWERFEYKYNIPPVALLSFKKAKIATDELEKNSLYLDCPDISSLPQISPV